MRIRTAAIGLAFAGLFSCSTRDVTVDFDRSYEFPSSGGYAWLERTPDVGLDGPGLERRVRRSVDANLAVLGFRLVPIERADLVVTWRAAAEDRRVSDAYGYGTGRWWDDESVTATERVFTEGSLTVDLFDAGTRTLVWRSTAVEAFEPSASPERRDGMVAEAVAEMFEGFPPGPQDSQ